MGNRGLDCRYARSHDPFERRSIFRATTIIVIMEMSRNVQSENTQNLKSSAAPVRLPAAPAPIPGTSQVASKRVACIDPDAVVVDKNIAKNDRFDLFSRQLVRRDLIDLLFLERGEKALHPCVVEAMSGSAEALYHAAARQLCAKSRAGVLTPAI